MTENIFKKRPFRIAAAVTGVIAAVYLMVYLDVVLRARSAYLEGEKYWAWHHNPELKRSALEKKYAEELKAADKKLSAGKIEKEEYDRRVQVLRFNKKRELEESSIKYAYVWYQTAVELFSPPESKWVRHSREKMQEARELWRQELLKKGIKVEDYMLE